MVSKNVSLKLQLDLGSIEDRKELCLKVAEWSVWWLKSFRNIFLCKKEASYINEKDKTSWRESESDTKLISP